MTSPCEKIISGRSLKYLAGFGGSLRGKIETLRPRIAWIPQIREGPEKQKKTKVAKVVPEIRSDGNHLCFFGYLPLEKK
jgi:hypothetical protein